MPNAASVLSHSPTVLALLRQSPLDGRIQSQLESTLQILEKWCDSSLESHYGFDYEMEYGPEYPSISPEIHVIDIESGSQAKQEVLSLVEKIEQRGGGHEIRFECNAGRKEDSAGMVDMSMALGASCWYTDVESGISVRIGDGGIENEARPLSTFSRFWLSGFPCIDGREIHEIREKEILEVVLERFAECLNFDDFHGSPESTMNRVEDSLRREGIEIIPGSEPGRLGFRREADGSKSDFTISERVFDPKSGEMVEELAALSLAESLMPNGRIITGLRWGYKGTDVRYKSLKNALLSHGNSWATNARRSLFEHHVEVGTLPSIFSDFMYRKAPVDSRGPSDSEVLVRSWFEGFPDEESRQGDLRRIVGMSWQGKAKKSDEYTILKWFVMWALHKGRFEKYPPKIRKEVEKAATRRELDIIALDPALGTIFVECKTSPKHPNRVAGRVQLGSLIGAIWSHRNATKIGVHAATRYNSRRQADGSIIAGWNSLRKVRELLSDEN